MSSSVNGQFVNGYPILSASVIQGPSAPPEDPELLPPSAMEAPPPYSTLPNTSSECHGTPIRSASSKKLCYMDFIPKLVKKRIFGKNQYESFSALVLRANAWLEEHNDINLLSCETMTWFNAQEKDIFSDDTTFKKFSTTVHLRGLRFWYEKLVIPSGVREHQAAVIKCQIFPMRPVENLTQLVSEINNFLSSNSCDGRIVGIETVRVTCSEGNLNVEETHWKEDLNSSRENFFAIRIFTLLGPTVGHETIGYQDFVPSRTNRNKDNRGYELFADVMDRACRWVARQQGVSFKNIQTIPVKLKKTGVSSEERCHYKEHGGRSTNFLNIVRAYFVVERGERAYPALPQPETRLSYRTFRPIPIAAMNSDACKFEDMRSLMERVNRWLQTTGAKVFSVETVVVQAANPLGSETTCMLKKDGTSQLGRYFFHVRLYLNGDYDETPAAAALVNGI